ncbi:PrsW family intramembrane metalloprotease [Streptomyces sp. NPDC059096]|uniref:CdiA C-terminal domain-containing protein n=1 Tax=Streptomyces sp. NPDC059096 TaxID=3346727 RepID=UPI0036A7F418
MTAAAVWGVLQLFVLSWPARSVRLSTVLLAIVVGVYGCGVVTALLQLAYTRLYADGSGRSLADVTDTTGYLVAPWLEELVKVSPLLLAGLSLKVRRQWGLTDFVLLGAALGAGFGLLESVLRFGVDADRAIARPEGGWIVPDSIFPPYVPGPEQVFSGWLPAPFGQSAAVGPPAAETFDHLVWTAAAGLAVGLLWRTRSWVRALAVVPTGFAVLHHTVNNYVAQSPSGQAGERAREWLETLDAGVWAVPLVCLVVAAAVDLRHVHRGKRTVPGVLLAAERADGDSVAALLHYSTWSFSLPHAWRRVPWSLLIALRYVGLRRSLLYATAVGPSADTDVLRRAVAGITARMDASDHHDAWRSEEIRTRLTAVRARGARRRWLMLVPWVLMLPSLLYLGVGSFTATAGLQEFFATGAGPRILLGFGVAALVWIAWQLVRLLRTARAASAQPLGELLAVHRFRLGTALGAATAGSLLLYRGLGTAGPEGRAITTFHLLDALDTFLVHLGFALLLLSLLALFPPGGLALAGVGGAGGMAAIGAVTAEAAISGALLGTAGVVLMAAGAGGSGAGGEGTGNRRDEGEIDESEKAFNQKERKIADLLKSEGKKVKAQAESRESGVRTADAAVDGVQTEFKSLDPGATSNTVKNQLNSAKGQARDAVLDSRGSGLDEEAAREGLGKFLRNNPPGRMDNIRIVGDGFNITWP